MGNRVSLFVTCMVDQLFPKVGMAMADVLERLGYRVDFPEEQHKALMGSRGADVPYAAARFIGIVHATMPEQNLSLGMWNADRRIRTAVTCRDADTLKELSYGDAGVVVVDVTDYSWKAYGGYLSSQR